MRLSNLVNDQHVSLAMKVICQSLISRHEHMAQTPQKTVSLRRISKSVVDV